MTRIIAYADNGPNQASKWKTQLCPLPDVVPDPTMGIAGFRQITWFAKGSPAKVRKTPLNRIYYKKMQI
jgi:hypothetical protein